MTLTADTIAKIADMMANGGRTVAGHWHNVNTGITCLCKDGDHDRCDGWIHPTGGPRECECPCHDDHRPGYREALAKVVKAMGLWRDGDFVTIDGRGGTAWRITFVDSRDEMAYVSGPDGQATVADFDDLHLFWR